jgi:ABC-type lipoprotein release transport system permease subunit
MHASDGLPALQCPAHGWRGFCPVSRTATGAAMAASIIPAWRASGTDPATILRAGRL